MYWGPFTCWSKSVFEVITVLEEVAELPESPTDSSAPCRPQARARRQDGAWWRVPGLGRGRRPTQNTHGGVEEDEHMKELKELVEPGLHPFHTFLISLGNKWGCKHWRTPNSTNAFECLHFWSNWRNYQTIGALRFPSTPPSPSTPQNQTIEELESIGGVRLPPIPPMAPIPPILSIPSLLSDLKVLQASIEGIRIPQIRQHLHSPPIPHTT